MRSSAAVVLAVAFLLTVLSATATAERATVACSTAAHDTCNTKGETKNYCHDPKTDDATSKADNSCKAMTAVTGDKFESGKPAGSQFCDGKFTKGSGACLLGAVADCTKDDKNFCIDGTTEVEKKCTASKFGTAEVGKRCYSSGAVPTKFPEGKSAADWCAKDLTCDASYKVCMPKAKVGEKCSADDSCVYGSACNYGTCVAYGTLPVGAWSTDINLCEGGVLQGAQCAPAAADKNFQKRCFSNNDCQDKVCDVDKDVVDEFGQGLCRDVHQKANIEYVKCVGQRCSDGKEDAETCVLNKDKCMQAFAKVECARECPKRSDLRYDGAAAKYTIKCKDLEVKKLEGCAIKPGDLFNDCDATYKEFSKLYLPSSANQQQVAAGAIGAAVLLLSTVAMLL